MGEKYFSRARVDGHRGNVPRHTEKIRQKGTKQRIYFKSNDERDAE
jgi:hypothetical protein